MPTYIALVRFTEEGVRTIKDGPGRLEQARKDFEAAGAQMKDFYLTFGGYDAVAIIEAPDDETMAKLSLTIASRGTSRTETLRAFTSDQFSRIVNSLP